MNDKLKKGTTTVALVCKNGIVMGADKRATAGYTVSHKKVVKVLPVSEHMAITTAGLVSDIQLFTKIIKAQLMLLKMRRGKEPTAKEAANMLANLSYNNIRRPSMVPGIVGFLLGAWDKTGGHLFEIGVDGSLMEADDYATDGSGSRIVLGVLETLYKKDMTIEEGKELAIKSLKAAMSRDIATGNGIDILVINAKGVEYIVQKEVKTLVK